MPTYVNPQLPVGTAFPVCTPTLTVAATYATGDYVGTSGSPMTFLACVLPGQSGWVAGATLISGTLTTVAIELWLFHTTVTPPADSAAWSITDAEAATLVAVIPFSTFYASALNSISQGQPDGGPKRFTSVTGNLFGCLVTRGTQPNAASDITVRLSVIQD
jgi:hypothetical protein